MGILNKSQQRVLKVLSGVELLRNNFHLGGGTALAEFYLKHRYSEDFDFFTSEDKIITVVSENIENTFKCEGIRFDTLRKSDTFLQYNLFLENEFYKLDIGVEPAFRHKPPEFNNQYNLQIENIIDLSCNKLSALFDRFDAKDFVDIFFIDKEIMKIDKLILLAQEKHIGMDNYWLSRAMYQVEEITFLPRMIKEIQMNTLKNFFLKKAEQLLMKDDTQS